MFEPLENCIKEELIPAIVGRKISELERRICALPYRYGSLGIINPTLSAERQYKASRKITAPLTKLMLEQNMNLALLNKDDVKDRKMKSLLREKKS